MHRSVLFCASLLLLPACSPESSPGSPPDSVADGAAVDVGAVGVDTGASADAPSSPDAGGITAHGCSVDSDCTTADACAGKLFCDTSGPVRLCRFVSGSAVVCDDSNDTVCLRNRCDPGTGSCAMRPTAKGTPCTDDDPCTVAAACDGGACVAGPASWCACQQDADCAAKPGWNLCSGAPYCDKASFPYHCEINETAAVACKPVDAPCMVNLCDPADGACKIAPASDGVPCDDGDPDTVGERCKGGLCVPGADLTSCQNNADCDAYEDGDVCNGTLYCDVASGSCKVNPATAIACPDANDTACIHNLCDPKTGACELTALKNGTACDDGDPCTAGDLCKVGACVAGATFTCPCATDAECVDKDDGNLCNGSFFCNAASKVCQYLPTSIVFCPSVDDTACSKNACQPKTGGCVATPAGETRERCEVYNGALLCHLEVKAPGEATQTNLPCDDGDACTAGDLCDGAVCKGGTDTCPCKVHADCLIEDDGDRCNGVPLCDKATGKCTEKQDYFAVVCPKNGDTACLANTCLPLDGSCSVVPVNDGKPCDDGKVCTVGESCAVGSCSGGNLNPCDDGKTCTQDSCDPLLGCQHPSICDDGNACTVDACDPKTGGCTFDAKITEGVGCDADSNGCTVQDTCSAGTCTAGTAVTCSIVVGACQVGACSSTSPSTFVCLAKAATDGTACDDGDACSLGDACKGGSCGKGAVAALGEVVDTAGAPHGWWSGAVRGNDARILLFGVQSDAAPGTPPKTRRWQLQRGWTLGPAEAATTVDAVGSSVHVAPAGALLRSDGRVVVVGTVHVGGLHRVRALGLEANLATPFATLDVANQGADMRAVASAITGGELLVAARRAASGPTEIALLRITDKPAAAVLHTLSSAASLEPYGVVGLGSGGVLVAGAATTATSSLPYLARVDAGVKAWSVTPDGIGAALVGVAPAGDGVLVAATAADVALAPKLCRFSLAGDAQWCEPLAGFAAIDGVVARSKDGVWVVGRQDVGGALLPRLVATTERGVAVSDLLLQGGGQRFHGLLASPGGTLTLLGEASTGGVAKPLRRQIDGWGAASCALSGGCIGKAVADCADAAACTADLCSAGKCSSLPISAACDDGDACTAGDGCVGGSCKPGGLADCDDDLPCTKDACHVALGCQHVFSGAQTACDDGDACTEGDGCTSNGCVGKKKNCDDGNPCTTDSCASASGCVHAHTDAGCDDGDICTDDLCNEASKACEHPHNTRPCDDGVACSAGAVCADGKCQAGVPGKKLFNRDFEKLGLDGGLPRALENAPDGGLYVFGYAYRANDTHYRSHAYRLSPSGATVWHGQYGDAYKTNTGRDYFIGATVDAKGAVGCGGSDHASAGARDGLIVAVDGSDGSERWLYRYGTADDEHLLDIARVDAGYIAVGTAFATGANGQQGWILRVGPQGFQLSSQQFGGTGFEVAHAVVGVGTDAVVATEQPGYSGASDTVVMRVDPSGKTIWQRRYAELGKERPRSMVGTADGGFALAIDHSTASRRGVAILKLAADGSLRWRSAPDIASWSAPDTDFEPVWAVAEDSAGRIVAGGFEQATFTGAVRHPRVATFDGATGRILRATDLDGGKNNEPLSHGIIYTLAATSDGVALGLAYGTNFMVQRIDDFHHTDCSAAGACADARDGGCDDGKACTAAACTAGKCSFPLEPTGVTCAGDEICVAAWACNNKGGCAAAANLLGGSLVDLGADDEYTAVIASRLGGDLRAGRTVDSKTGGVRPLLIRHDAAGDSDGFDMPTDEAARLDDMVELPDGRIVTVGRFEGVDDKRARIRIHQPTTVPLGAPLLLKTTDAGADEWHVLASVVESAFDHVVASGSACAGTTCAPWLVRVRVDGSATATHNVRLPVAGRHLGLIRHGSGLVAVGDSPGGAVVRGLGETGTIGWTTVLPGDVAAQANAVARTSSGELVVVGTRTASGAAQGFVAQLGPGGALGWSKAVTVGGTLDLRGVALLADGRIGVAGSAAGEGSDGLVAMLTATGIALWHRSYDKGKADALVGLIAYPDGGLFAVGRVGDLGKGDFHRVRTDAWGNDSCAVAGYCAGTSPADCDDGDACTADSCSPGIGCVHTPTACP
ncbi:MAG: hypothetical protein H6747_11460 [Deltaproteobacteria bacterium]|nr:hypothetical protein [Deltaproteobacteria bacterium]